jgi:hypothetical protein
LHQKGGKPPKLTVEDKLYITLKYLREYRTMDSIAAEYGVCKGTVCLSIQWVEDTLAGDGAFALPGKRPSGGNQSQSGMPWYRTKVRRYGKPHKPP